MKKKIDYDYMNTRFVKFLVALSNGNHDEIESVRAELAELAESDQDIRAYLERIEECEKEAEERKAERKKTSGRRGLRRELAESGSRRGGKPRRAVRPAGRPGGRLRPQGGG